jgi:hypothetical protein
VVIDRMMDLARRHAARHATRMIPEIDRTGFLPLRVIQPGPGRRTGGINPGQAFRCASRALRAGRVRPGAPGAPAWRSVRHYALRPRTASAFTSEPPTLLRAWSATMLFRARVYGSLKTSKLILSKIR